MSKESDGTENAEPQVTVVAEDGRRIGVRVLPFRCTTLLVMLDLDHHPWTFSRGNLPPTSNAWIRAVADFTAEERDYHWDTPRYRELCIEGGLDPDRHRPRFRDDQASIGGALVETLCRQSQWPSHAAVNIVFDLVDVLRIDPWRSAVDVEALRATVQFDARNRPKVIEEALTMIRRAGGWQGTGISAVLGMKDAGG